ncbi:putative Ankyrin repeat-containing domain protein [Seiridium unicorne]|uniref:Ankyrin repeat-containing domain protein n=1 Tax=Seiridium unicorne TaxID=138068 RepID=A0ABR2UUN9_9PEZI
MDPSKVICINPVSSVLDHDELSLQVDEKSLQDLHSRILTPDLPSDEEDRPTSDARTADSSGAEPSASDVEAIHVHIAELVSSANKTYQIWQRYMRNGSNKNGEEDLSLSKVLKQICVEAHGLGLQCFEVDVGRDAVGLSDMLPAGQQPHLIQTCIRTFSRLQEAVRPSNVAPSSGSLSADTRDQFYTELIGHKIWITACRGAASLGDVLKLLAADIDEPSHRDVHSSQAGYVSLTGRISRKQAGHSMLRNFRFPVQEILIQHAMELSPKINSETFLKSSSFTRWISTPGYLLWVTARSRMELAMLAAPTVQYLGQDAGVDCAVCYFIYESPSPGTSLLRSLKAFIGQLAQQSARAFEILQTRENEPMLRTFEWLCSTLGLMLRCFRQISIVLVGPGIFGAHLAETATEMLTILFAEPTSQTSASLPVALRIIIFSDENENVQECIQRLTEARDGSQNGSSDETSILTPSEHLMNVASGQIKEVCHLRWDASASVVPTSEVIADHIELVFDSLAEDIESRETHRHDAELQDAMRQLFHSSHSLNFQQWVIEYARRWFPLEFGFQALSHKPLVGLTSILAGSQDIRLQIAASMGLRYLCEHLLGQGADVNGSSALGTPIHCGLMGPGALAGPWVHVVECNVRLGRMPGYRVPLRETVDFLLDQGASCGQKSPTKDDLLSAAVPALMACSRFMDAELFFRIIGERPEFDAHFRTHFVRGIFLDAINSTHPKKSRAQSYLNDLCEGLSQRLISRIRMDETVDEIYESVMKHTLANNLDWLDNIAERRVPGISDEIFDYFVERKGISSLSAIRLVSKDPRFDPNMTCKNGSPLLLEAWPNGHDMVKLFVEKGADLSVTDEQGLTLAHSSAQFGMNDILRYVVEKGADTGLLTVPNDPDDPDPEFLAQSNVWHYAASQGPSTLSTLIDLGIKNQEDLFAVSEAGTTPLMEMILKLHPLIEDSEASQKVFDTAIEILRKIPLKDSRLFQSKLPVIHVAAGLGSQELIQILLQLGAEPCLSNIGASPLHLCYVEAGQPFLRFVRDLCKHLPLQDEDGETPLESTLGARFRQPGVKLPDYVYEELLCPETRESKDCQGLGLWERVCVNVIPTFAKMMGTRTQIIIQLIGKLINQGIMQDYESTSGVPAIKPFMDGISKADTVPVFLSSVVTQILESTKFKQALTNGVNDISCLKWATRANDTYLVGLMLQHGLSVHEESFNTSALQVACSSVTCNMATFRLLLDQADPTKLDVLNKKGLGLIHLLLLEEVNQRELKLRALLSKGADPNLCSISGIPALLMYLVENQTECVDILLEFGADVNARNRDGMDMALTAALRGHVLVLEKLYNHDKLKVDWNATCLAKFNVRRPENSITTMEFLEANALHLAALHGNDGVLEFYLRNQLLTDLEATNFGVHYRPFHFACLGGSSTTIKLLSTFGADVKTLIRDGSSGLHIAVRAFHAGAVHTLIGLGLPVDSLDNCRTTALVYAIKQGSKDISKALLAATDSDKITRETPDNFPPKKIGHLLAAMDAAIKQSDIKLCRLVWNEGCPLDLPLPSCRGCTPLMAALGHDRTDIALWMLEVMDDDTKKSGFGGRCSKHFSSGTTALQIACGLKDSEELLKKLLDAYLAIESNWLQWPLGILHVCASNNNTKAIDVIIKYVKDNEERLRARYPTLPKELDKLLLSQTITATELNEPYYYGLAPLHVAIFKGSTEAAKLLLESGADANQNDVYQSTPLHLAIKEEELEIVKELLQHGCLIDRQDGSGYSPLMRAVDEGWLDCVKLLVDAGADQSLYDSDQMSLLNIAGDSSRAPAVFQYLVQLGFDAYRPDNYGFFPLHDAMLDTNFTSYIVNSGLDFYRACGKDVFKGLLSMALECRGILPMIIRRIPSEFLPDALINIWPARYVSPLCNAARRGNIEALKILIRYGADLEFEGCDDGTALMSACRAGHLSTIAHLVRAGANISYVKDGKVRNALLAGKRFDVVVNWLLVGRWTDQKQIGARSEDEGNDSSFKPWAGIMVAEMELNGVGNQYGHAWKESMLEHTADKLVLSVGSGSGLLEALLLERWSTLSEPKLFIEGVEVQQSVESTLLNKYLPEQHHSSVKGTWDLSPRAGDAAAFMFVYPRSPKLISSYLGKFAQSKLDTVVWLGPKCDWSDFEKCFEGIDGWLTRVVSDGESGLLEYEMLALMERQ